METIDTSNLTIDSSGRVSFSGLSSGIDFANITDAIIAAKRIPVVTLENRIADNEEKITAYLDLRTKLTTLSGALGTLRGAVTLDGSNDIFRNKSVFASTTRSDGVTPSAAGSLIGVTATNQATEGVHEIDMRRVASAHKISSKSFSSLTTAVATSGTITIKGATSDVTVTIQSTDKLTDIRDRFNNVNTGTNATGVTASIVSVSSTEHYLILTKDTAGENIVLTDTGTVLSALGLSTTNGVGNFRNGLPTGTGNEQSKVESGDGIAKVLFDGTQDYNGYLISYVSATKVLTLTRGDGATDTATLATAAIGVGATETASFSTFGIDVVLNENFDKSTNIVVDADTSSVGGGTGAITDSTITITDTSGNISGMNDFTLTFSNFGGGNNITISAAVGFSATGVDLSTTGTKRVTLTDASGNSVEIELTVATGFNGSESSASIELQELENLVVRSGTEYSNVLQKAQTARFTADGLINAARYESNVITNKTSVLSSVITPTNASGSFTLDATVVSYNTASDSLEDLAKRITESVANVRAKVVADGVGFRMDITTSGSAISVTDTSGLLADLGVDSKLVIERQSNTVTDVFTGVTMSIFQAEAGTTIKIEIEQDLGALKTAIQTFVDAYNDVRKFINTHSKTSSTTGAKADDAGVLFGSRTLSSIQDSLASLVGGSVTGISSNFAVIAQIGVTFVDNAAVTDPLDKNTLEIDATKLDAALLSNPDDVRRLLAFDFTSSSSNVTLLDFNGKTTFNASGYTLNVNYDDRLKSNTTTIQSSFTQVDAETGGPAADGISAIAFNDSVPTKQAFRYSYNGTTEDLTVRNLTTGTSETIDVTTLLDAVVEPDGTDLLAGQTAAINFSTLGVTITLSGDNSFTRATGISDGTLNTAGLGANIVMTGGAVTTPTSGMNKAAVDALIAAGAYDQSTGLLTLNLGSSGAGEAHFNTAAGIKFDVDTSGPPVADISATDLDDAGAHTIDVYVNDGSSEVKVATLTFTTLTGAALDTGTLTIDLGTGLLAETGVTTVNAPMSNYLTVTDGSFEIRDSNSALLGTVNYLALDSITDLATKISAISNVTATVLTTSTTFQLQIVHDTNDAITLQSDTGSVVSQLNITDVGNTVLSANIDGNANGVSDATTTVSSDTIKATSLSNAEGLKMFFNGVADESGIKLDFTTGIAMRMFFDVASFIDQTDGIIQGEIAAIEGQNLNAKDRIDAMDLRLTNLRTSLSARFIAAEQAMKRMESLLRTLTEAFNVLNGRN